MLSVSTSQVDYEEKCDLPKVLRRLHDWHNPALFLKRPALLSSNMHPVNKDEASLWTNLEKELIPFKPL